MGETIIFYSDDKKDTEKVKLSISSSSLDEKTLQQRSTPSEDPNLGEIVGDTKRIKFGNLEGYSYTARISNENINYDNTYIFLAKGENEYLQIVAQGKVDEGLSTIEGLMLSTLTIL
jgi:hypothetical protein